MYLEDLRRYVERIDYALQSKNREEYAELDKVTDTWKKSANEQADGIRQEKTIAKRAIAAVTVVWTVLNTVFGMNLKDLLTALSLVD